MGGKISPMTLNENSTVPLFGYGAVIRPYLNGQIRKQFINLVCDPPRTRTLNLLIKSQLLCQLS
jgi:hypothetical protein